MILHTVYSDTEKLTLLCLMFGCESINMILNNAVSSGVKELT